MRVHLIRDYTYNYLSYHHDCPANCNCGLAKGTEAGDYVDGGVKTDDNKYPWLVYFR